MNRENWNAKRVSVKENWNRHRHRETEIPKWIINHFTLQFDCFARCTKLYHHARAHTRTIKRTVLIKWHIIEYEEMTNAVNFAGLKLSTFDEYKCIMVMALISHTEYLNGCNNKKWNNFSFKFPAEECWRPYKFRAAMWPNGKFSKKYYEIASNGYILSSRQQQ